MNQVKNSFDLVSLKKLAIDTLTLFGPQAALYALAGLQTLNFGQYTPLVGFLVTFAIQAVKRYVQGENQVIAPNVPTPNYSDETSQE